MHNRASPSPTIFGCWRAAPLLTHATLRSEDWFARPYAKLTSMSLSVPGQNSTSGLQSEVVPAVAPPPLRADMQPMYDSSAHRAVGALPY